MPQLTVDEIKEWDIDQVIDYLKEKFPKLSQRALNILRDNEVEGISFLGLTKEELMQDGMVRGPAKVIAEHVQELKGMYHLRLIRPPIHPYVHPSFCWSNPSLLKLVSGS